jgi:hypothetical protein
VDRIAIDRQVILHFNAPVPLLPAIFNQIFKQIYRLLGALRRLTTSSLLLVLLLVLLLQLQGGRLSTRKNVCFIKPL